jgi:Barstar (barnase inhibitor)
MKLDHLLRPDAPWLQVLPGTASEAADATYALQRTSSMPVAARLLRGRKMRTADRLFDEFAAALQFPPYFGENWDALDECLADLEWLAADAYVLVILDATQVLEDKPEDRRLLAETLERVAREWGRPGNQARPAKVFRVVVQCAPGWPAAASVG